MSHSPRQLRTLLHDRQNVKKTCLANARLCRQQGDLPSRNRWYRTARSVQSEITTLQTQLATLP